MGRKRTESIVNRHCRLSYLFLSTFFISIFFYSNKKIEIIYFNSLQHLNVYQRNYDYHFDQRFDYLLRRHARHTRATQRPRRPHALHSHHLRQARRRRHRLPHPQLPAARLLSPRTPQVQLPPRDRRHGHPSPRISSILRYARI